MSPEAEVFRQVMLTIMMAVGAFAAIGVSTAYAMQKLKRGRQSLGLTPDPRIDQIQQSLDAIAVEIERITEAQRFTTKLLVERGEKSPLGR